MKKIFEGLLEVESIDDGGQAMIAVINGSDVDEQMFVRVQSWDETLQHPQFKMFKGKKVRVTIEVIDNGN